MHRNRVITSLSNSFSLSFLTLNAFFNVRSNNSFLVKSNFQLGQIEFPRFVHLSGKASIELGGDQPHEESFSIKKFPSFTSLVCLFLSFSVKNSLAKKGFLLRIREFSSFIIGLLGPMLYLIYPFFCLFSKFIFRFSNFQTGSQ